VATVQIYNNARRFLLGMTLLDCDLYASLSFVASATTLAAARGGSMPLDPLLNGYGEPPTMNGFRRMTALNTSPWVANGANGINMVGLLPAIWNATGAGLSAAAALIGGIDIGGTYRPLFHLSFGGTVTAPAGTPFIILPPTNGWIQVASS
jgi:hypothetical protein